MLRAVEERSCWNCGELNIPVPLSLIPTISLAFAAAGSAPTSAQAQAIGRVNLASRLTIVGRRLLGWLGCSWTRPPPADRACGPTVATRLAGPCYPRVNGPPRRRVCRRDGPHRRARPCARLLARSER